MWSISSSKMHSHYDVDIVLCPNFFQRELADKFKVRGIPTLIFVDGKTGKLINNDGHAVVEGDPYGDNFPWRSASKSVLEIIADGKLVGCDKKEITLDHPQEKIIGIFFSFPLVSQQLIHQRMC